MFWQTLYSEDFLWKLLSYTSGWEFRLGPSAETVVEYEDVQTHIKYSKSSERSFLGYFLGLNLLILFVNYSCLQNKIIIFKFELISYFFIENFSPLPGFELTTSWVPSWYITNWAAQALIQRNFEKGIFSQKSYEKLDISYYVFTFCENSFIILCKQTVYLFTFIVQNICLFMEQCSTKEKLFVHKVKE